MGQDLLGLAAGALFQYPLGGWIDRLCLYIQHPVRSNDLPLVYHWAAGWRGWGVGHLLAEQKGLEEHGFPAG